MPNLSRFAWLAIASNIFFSVILVLLNKRLVVTFGFTYMTVLSGLHFAASFIVCMLMICIKAQKYKAVNSYWSIFRISLGSLLSVVFMNYCLSQSTVGFYQVAKLFCIPLTIFFESMFGLRQENLTWRLQLSLAVTVLGMMLVIKEEISTNMAGIVWGFLGVATTSLSQIFFGPLKKGLGLDAFQLLFHTSPWLTFGSFLMIPSFEKVDALIAYDLSSAVVLNLLLTCIVAVAFNISNYVVLAEISPLSYSIMGHLKTVVIISVGSYLFSTYPSSLMLGGMLTAIMGVLLFTFEKEYQLSSKSPLVQQRPPPVSLPALDAASGVESGASAQVRLGTGDSTSAGTEGSGPKKDSAESKKERERNQQLQQLRREARMEGFLKV